MIALLGSDCIGHRALYVPAPLCADAQADAKSFVEIPAIAEIDDGCG
jgi:hypothetical protein